MAIRARCGHCGTLYQVADHLAGRKAKCKKCGVVFVMQAQEASPPAAAPPRAAPPRPIQRAAAPATPRPPVKPVAPTPAAPADDMTIPLAMDVPLASPPVHASPATSTVASSEPEEGGKLSPVLRDRLSQKFGAKSKKAEDGQGRAWFASLTTTQTTLIALSAPVLAALTTLLACMTHEGLGVATTWFWLVVSGLTMFVTSIWLLVVAFGTGAGIGCMMLLPIGPLPLIGLILLLVKNPEEAKTPFLLNLLGGVTMVASFAGVAWLAWQS